MVGWWPLDEVAGATTVVDIGLAPPNNGVPQPAPISAGGPNTVTGNLIPTATDKALYFYTPTTYVDVTHDNSLNLTNLTIDAWYVWGMPNSSNFGTIPAWSPGQTTYYAIVDKLDTNSNSGYAFFVRTQATPLPPNPVPNVTTVTVTVDLVLALGNSIFATQIYSGTTTFPPTTTPPTPYPPPTPAWPHNGQWFHVAVTVDQTSTIGKFFLNGSQVGNNFTPTTIVNNTASLWIGKSRLPVSGVEFTLNEIELFNMALPASDIHAIATATAGKCKPTPDPTSELGDAPDRTNNWGNAPMTAYPSVPANFPTVFNSSPPGPKHLSPKSVAWLGADVSIENEADIFPPDQDGLSNIDPPNNIPDRDGKDDGLVKPANLPACGQIQLNYTLGTFTNAPLTQNMYVNVWLDYNRDGDWEDSFKCPLGPATTGLASEWAVQNELISAGSAPGARMTQLFTAANLAPGQDIWVRITLSDQPAQAPSSGSNPDGQGPPSGFKYGETEDYLWKNIGLPPTETRCDLKIEKKVQPSPLVNGQQAIVTITVTNVGNTPCPGPTTVTETVPSGLALVSASGSGWICVGPICTYPLPIPANGSVSVTYTFNVTAPPGTAVQNCATVSNSTDTNPANNQSCVTTPVVPGVTVCDLKITKAVSPNPVQSGQQVTITLIMQNVGTGSCPPGPQIFGTAVQDPRPAGLTFTAPPVPNQPGWQCSLGVPTGNASCGGPGLTLPPNYTVTFTLNATVTAPAGSTIQNCATVTNQNDTNPANNQSCVTIQVAPSGVCDLKITKTVSPNPVQSGGQITVALIVQNIGTASCGPMPGGILVADPNTPGLVFTVAPVPNQPVWTCGLTGPGSGIFCSAPGLVMPPNYSVTFTINNVNVTAAAGSILQNCAVVTNTGGNTNPANDQSCVTIQVVPKTVCDLKITKTASPNPVQSGQQVTIVLTVMNVGTAACSPGAFPGTAVRDNKPTGLTFQLPVTVNQPGWQCGLEIPSGNLTCATQQNTLQPNASVTFTFKATANVPMGGTIQNCATVSNSNDTNAANNQSCVTIQVPPPSLSLDVASLGCTLAIASLVGQGTSCLYKEYFLRRNS
jgi:uncharacterized repeat protein (TIGR01451 family)